MGEPHLLSAFPRAGIPRSRLRLFPQSRAGHDRIRHRLASVFDLILGCSIRLEHATNSAFFKQPLKNVRSEQGFSWGAKCRQDKFAFSLLCLLWFQQLYSQRSVFCLHFLGFQEFYATKLSDCSYCAGEPIPCKCSHRGFQQWWVKAPLGKPRLATACGSGDADARHGARIHGCRRRHGSKKDS
ncbi:hypothetical protein OPV22_009367 [Ensete ventricosum]|uniref:Uncharacterized protein n=1 Tax=Ensete ventricosum TaxID=4639 RepID=A0AAV8PZB4_ENSVE|nr:hypothetical protein OPV22_009367 [Ensete ventricosum]